MGSLFRLLMNNPLIRPILQPIVRPLTRFLVGVIAIPLFRLFLRHVVRLQQLDAELEKDFEQWFRGSLLLLAATRNMEQFLFPWVSSEFSSSGEKYWMIVGFRLLLAIGVVESMPDQELFAIIHPGPPKLKLSREYGIFRELREQWWAILRGVLCQHLNRSSPVFAILAALADGYIGWMCYGLAVGQYLIIGLVTSKDKAVDVLTEFDRQVARRRQELLEEFHPNAADNPAINEAANSGDCLSGDRIPADNVPDDNVPDDNVLGVRAQETATDISGTADRNSTHDVGGTGAPAGTE